MIADVQDAQKMSLDEIRFQRRYVQMRLNELKQEREALVARKQNLETLLAEHRGRKPEQGLSAD